MTPIMAAVTNGYLESAGYLAEKNADLKIRDKNDQSIIHLAAKNNKHKVIKLLQKKSNIDENDLFDNTPLHMACSKGHKLTVEVLLNLGAAIENKNEDERTPFLLAAENGHDDVVECLLDKYESKKPLNSEKEKERKHLLNDSDEDDNSALHLAASKKMTRTVELLLRFKADFRKRNMKGWTPLECAAASGSRKCVLSLLDAGADVDPRRKGKDVETPLQLAAIKGHTKVIKLLLERGADVTRENKKKKNALELAIEHGNISVARIILDGEKWREAMSSSHKRQTTGLPETPMRMLIRKFPSLATQVLDKCITPPDQMDSDEEEDKATNVDSVIKGKNVDDESETKPIDPEALGYDMRLNEKRNKKKYEFDFTFLEDSYLKENEKEMEKRDEMQKKEKMKNAGHWEKFQGWYNAEQQKEEGELRHGWENLNNIRNHPLMVMSRHQQVLLKHPLCLALLSHKWDQFKMLFWLYNIFYLFYLGLITTYVLMGQNLLYGSQMDMDIIWWTTLVFIIIGLSLDLYEIHKVCCCINIGCIKVLRHNFSEWMGLLIIF